MKKLVIVESPHKASLIQGFLGDKYITLSSKGHITEIAKGGKFGIGIDINNNFEPKYILSPDKVSTLEELLQACKKCDEIYLCGDPDREGAQICFQLRERLKDTGLPFKRAVFNEIKKSTVIKAIENAGELDMNQVNSCKSRQVLDRLVGFSASPFTRSVYPEAKSAGRVQSVVVRLISDREDQINAFIPEDFWTIQATVENSNKEKFIAKYPYKITNEQFANDVYAKLSDKNVEYVVSSVNADEENKYAPPPLITSTLQRIMSKDYGLGAEKSMAAAQKLYENGYISYMRTDSVRVGDEALEDVRNYLTTNNYSIPKKPNTYKVSESAQDGHVCIHPVDINLIPNNNMAIIDPDEKKVYEVIWKYFVASQMLPAVYSTLKITMHIKNDKSAELRATGKALKSNGYLDVLGGVSDTKIDIPNLQVGDIIKLHGNKPVKLEKKSTQPPPRFSEDKLIKELETRGIGRPSTFATLLSTITNRNYVEKRGNVYHPTELGKKITDILVKQFSFLDYDFTKDMEKKLDLIERGKLDHIEMLKEFYNGYSKELFKSYNDYGKNEKLCTKCGNCMTRNKGKFGYFFACINPACKLIVNDTDKENS